MNLNDFATIQLAIVGILVSVATLIFATIVSKREEYRSIRKSTDTNLLNRAVEVNNDINKLKRYGIQLLWVTATSFVLYICFTVVNNICDESYICLANCIAGILSLGVLIWIICLSVKVVGYYKKVDDK